MNVGARVPGSWRVALRRVNRPCDPALNFVVELRNPALSPSKGAASPPTLYPISPTIDAPLTQRDVDGVAAERLGKDVSVSREDLVREAMQVERVGHLSFVHEPDADTLAHFRRDWRCRGEALAVDREPAEQVVPDERVVDIGGGLETSVLQQALDTTQGPN